FAGELIGRARGRVSFGDGLHAGGDVRGFLAAPDAFAESAIAAVPRKAGDHQITETAQAGEGFALRAARDPEPADFHDGTGDQRGFGIIAETKAVTDAGRDGNYVLQRAAQFNPQQVRTRIDTESGTTEQPLHAAGR